MWLWVAPCPFPPPALRVVAASGSWTSAVISSPSFCAASPSHAFAANSCIKSPLFDEMPEGFISPVGTGWSTFPWGHPTVLIMWFLPNVLTTTMTAVISSTVHVFILYLPRWKVRARGKERLQLVRRCVPRLTERLHRHSVKRRCPLSGGEDRGYQRCSAESQSQGQSTELLLSTA